MTVAQDKIPGEGAFIRAMRGFHKVGLASPTEIVDIFSRLLIEGWLENDLTPELARRWGAHLGHYGRVALAEQEQAHADTSLRQAPVSFMDGVRR